MSNWRRGVLVTTTLCGVIVVLGVLLGDWLGFFITAIGVLGAFVAVITFFRDRGPVRPAETLDLLKETTAKRFAIGPVTIAPADDIPIPWLTLDGPAYNDATEDPSGPDALGWLVSAPRPIVVIGDEGAGKSTLARQLATRRGGGGDRAVICVSLANWDMTHEVLDWTAMEIARVTARRWDERVSYKNVRKLLDNGYVEVVFDGLDEAPDGSIETFVRGLSDSGMTAWFLFTRLNSPALLPDQSRILHDVIRLEPIPAATASQTISGWGRAWQGLAEEVAASPDRDASRLLRTPLFLTIAGTMSRRNEPPPPQLASGPYDEAADALMSWLLTTAIDSPGVSDPRRRHRWLRTLAGILERNGRDDFAWWDLAHAAPWILPTLLGTLLAALPVVLVELGTAWAYGRTSLGLILGPWELIGVSVAVACVTAPLLAGLTGSVPRDAPPIIRVAQSGAARIGIAGGVLAGVLIGVGAKSWSAGIRFFPFALLLVGGAAWLVGAIVAGGPRRWLARIGVAQDLSQRDIPRRLGFSFTSPRLLISLAVGSIPAVLFALSFLSPNEVRLFARPLQDNLLGGLIIATLTLLLLSVGKPSRNPPDHRSALSGNAVFGSVTAILSTFAFTVFFLLLAWLMSPPTDFHPTTSNGVDFGEWLAQQSSGQHILILVFLFAPFVAIAVGCAMVGLVASSAGRYTLNLVVLSITRQLPWRLNDFLTWSHDAGILRQSGQTYSFRHDSIRRHLSQSGHLGAGEEARPH